MNEIYSMEYFELKNVQKIQIVITLTFSVDV